MEKKPTQSSEEIDLLYFFRPVTNAVKRATDWGLNFIKLLAYNRFLFAFILLLGGIGGYCLRYVIPPSYQTTGIFVSDMLPGRYCASLVNGLNELRKPRNIPLLAKELNISTDVAWQIRGIEANSSPKDTFSIYKKDSILSVFNVTLTLADMSHVAEIQKGIIAYLQSNPLAKTRRQAREQGLRTQIAELDIRIKSLDTLRDIVNNSVAPRSHGQGFIYGEPINPVTVYQAQMTYIRDRLNLQERLSTIDPVEVLQPFFPLAEYNTPNYDKLMNYAFIAAFLFGLLVVWLIGRRPAYLRGRV